MKKIIALFASLCVMSAFAFPASALIEPTDTFYVADYANVLDADTEEMIIERNIFLEEMCGGQIVVATVDFLDGEDIGDYIYQLFNDWEVGSKEKDNGLLILLVIGEENYWALQGTGIADKLTAGDIDHILYDYLEADFAVGDYSAGVEKVFLAFYEEYESLYGIRYSQSGTVSDDNWQEIPDGYYPYEEQQSGWDLEDILFVIIAIIIVVAVISAFSGNSSGGSSVRRRSAPRTRTVFIPTTRSYRRPSMPRSRPTGGFGSRPSVSRPSRPSVSRPSRPSSGGSRSFGGARGGGGSSRGGGAGRRR